MWTLDALWRDPLEATVVSRHNITSRIARFSCRLDDWLTLERQKQCQKAGRVAEIAVADYVARVISNTYYQDHQNDDNGVTAVWFEPIDRTTQRSYYYSSSSSSRRTKNGNKNTESKSCPFQLERTDITVVNHQILQIYLRFFFVLATEATTTTANNNDQRLFSMAQQTGENVLHSLLSLEKKPALIADLMHHVAVAILQDRLRRKLNEIEAVAFIANGAILPRKSGASMAPMTSPPAIPFRAPTDSHMCRTIVVEDIPEWIQYFDEDDDSDEELDNHNGNKNMIRPFQIKNPKNGCSGTYLEVTGLVIPKGVSLIVGGGYHGKSTLLRCIAAGVYNKVPGDGREFCVTVETAVAIRAEDGRYINNCNVSGFISNLPTAAADTQHFSTGEASGSTSQAANVVEAMEMGAKALLVDEDVSAANFMARDGRMRALVMDESITPLLYRVNGLYSSHGISSIVVVGGVGDWLDVPNNVIHMDRYVCKDATLKAQSVSKQFSHGHVQYGGRGVVHRLNWEKSATPNPRRPVVQSPHVYNPSQTAVVLLDGSDIISLQHVVTESDDQSTDDNMSVEFEDGNNLAGRGFCSNDDEGDRYIDLSKCEQLINKPQLYGIGLCVVWLLNLASRHPDMGLLNLLQMLDDHLDAEGMLSLIWESSEAYSNLKSESRFPVSWNGLVEIIGVAYRPRRFEVGQAITRLRGLTLEEIPIPDDGSEAAAKAEAERKRKELLEIWHNRRQPRAGRFAT